LHSEGLSHPGLSVHHLLRSSSGAVKLAGLASMGGAPGLDCGSEIAKKRDVYKLGAALFAVFFGSHPPAPPAQLSGWQVTSAADFLAQLMHQDPDSRPSVSSALSHPWLRARPPSIDITESVSPSMDSTDMERALSGSVEYTSPTFVSAL
jgi:serine/threonine protein kinase